ncbi:uncharacterized protein LOC142224251 [Haematobia irritans]|uniref:uncharacterized protein LOC142224251 n=1 Tax=Haematobia irritans TaxID=7368 RepID=UPI003F504A16
MNFQQLEELTMPWSLGDKFKFTIHFQRWRDEIKLPISRGYFSTNTRESPSLSPSSAKITYSQSTLESSDTEDIRNIRLTDILKDHNKGRLLIEASSNKAMLTDDERQTLIHLIVQYFQKKDLQMSLTTSYQLENQILEMYPKEKLTYYRTERRGKIYAKFHNSKRLSRSILKERSTDMVKARERQISKIEFHPEEDAQTVIRKLKYEKLNIDLFYSKWGACSQFRLKQIFEECQNIGDILTKWPQYKRNDASVLIDIDFERIHPNHDKIENWNEKIMRIFLLLKKSNHFKDDIPTKLINSLNNDAAQKDPDMFAVKILWCLHYYLIPTARRVSKNEAGKKISVRIQSKILKIHFFIPTQLCKR